MYKYASYCFLHIPRYYIYHITLLKWNFKTQLSLLKHKAH